MMNFNEMYDKLVELNIATESEIDLVTDINGNTIETLDDILYARTGYMDIEDYMDYMEDMA